MKGIHVTKRDLFYTDVKLFEKQTVGVCVCVCVCVWWVTCDV